MHQSRRENALAEQTAYETARSGLAAAQEAYDKAKAQMDALNDELLYVQNNYQSELSAMQREPYYKTITENAELRPVVAEKDAKTVSGEQGDALHGVVLVRKDAQGNETKTLFSTNGLKKDDLDQLTDDEEKTLIYLMATRGQEAVDEYLSTMKETLRYRQGEDIAEFWNYPVLRELFGLYAGTVGSLNNLAQNLSGTARDTTPLEYAGGIIAENPNWAPGDVLKTIARSGYGAASSLGNMLPSLAVSYLSGGIGGAAGLSASAAGILSKAAGATTTVLSAKGGAYKQALESGMTKGQAGLYSTLVGLSEAGLQYLIGGVSQLGGINQWTESAIAKIGTAEAQAAAKLGFSVLGEEVEENLQNYLEPLFTTLITGKAYEAPSFEEFIETTLATALTVGATEGVPLAVNSKLDKRGSAVTDTQEYQQLTAQLVERWAQAALEIPDQTIQEAGQRILAALERGETPQAEWVLQAAQAAGADSTTIDAIRDGKISAQNSEAPAQQTDVT